MDKTTRQEAIIARVGYLIVFATIVAIFIWMVR
jgi:hypothetical protein